MKLITKDTDYAITALLELSRSEGRTMSASALSEHLDISHAFLRRILQVLAANGIISSRRGTGGGFTLVKEPKAITVREIVELFQGPIRVSACDGGGFPCARTTHCILRRKLLGIESRIISELMSITIASLAEEPDAQ